MDRSPTTQRPATRAGGDGAAMTKAERNELAKLARMRERLAKAGIGARVAELEADFEEQLARQYDPLDEMWRQEYERASRAVTDLNRTIAERCEQGGIPTEFAPKAHMAWATRGENFSAGRRAELRKVAVTRLAASAKAAKAEVERRSVEVQTQLLADGLESEEAQAFLASMPTAETLMPRLSVAEIEAATKLRTKGPARQLLEAIIE